jgi:hypothetical protein
MQKIIETLRKKSIFTKEKSQSVAGDTPAFLV